MSHTLFISDLHLSPQRPAIAEQFFRFLENDAVRADALYILGDLFEYWIGDDDTDSAFNAGVIGGLRRFADSGTPLLLMHGNRDFLMGDEFAAACGATLIIDPTLTDFYGTRTLLMHGDTLCTDDTEYQKFRASVRNPAAQSQFLAQPLATRREQALRLRAGSEAAKQQKREAIMDVNVDAVTAALSAHGYPRLIHGHTHRPARHVHVVDGHECERWVLADWYQRGSYLRCDESGCTAVDAD
jgi:UDP-2,3-diacylglucosamine hydrolase